MEVVVGVDLATAHVRAAAADGAGRVLSAGSAPLDPPESPRPGWTEQDAGSWWPSTVAALRQVTAGLAPGHRVVAVSVAATSGTVVALGPRGEPVGPALMYSDQRAGEEAERAQAAGARRWSALGLRVQPSFGLAKWGWLCRRSAGAGGRAVARLAHASDVVVGHLVGGPAPTDWSHALKSGYDALRQEWAWEAMAALGVGPHLLPDVLPPGSAAGQVSREPAEETGLPPGCEVRLGMTDGCASQLAAGAGEPGCFVSVLGTTLVLKGASRALVGDPAGAVYSHRHPQGWWLPGGASSTGGSALTGRFAGRDLARLDRLAARHGPAATVTYPLVGRGERFPFVAAEAEGFVLGRPSGETERYRSALEGVAFVERLGYERLASLGAPAQAPVSASGAGSRSRTWNRIRATVLGAPLLEKPSADTARGACILAAAGTLHHDVSAAARAMAVSGPLVDPDEREQAALEDSYRRFLAGVEARGWLVAGGRSGGPAPGPGGAE